MRRPGVWLALCAMLCAPGPVQAEESSAAPAAVVAGNAGAAAVVEPEGYRMDDYRSPTPATLKGAIVVDTAAARRAFDDNATVFVDVLPRAPKPKGLPAGTLWHPKPRADIPGSIWLVDTGYGALPPQMEAYFLTGLERSTAGDRGKPLLFYCLRDCWMSWNAAKRALAAGYTKVLWYPDGTDGWSEAGHALEPREPEPRPDE